MSEGEPPWAYISVVCSTNGGELDAEPTSRRGWQVPEDQVDGRQPTSHERLTCQTWDASYHNGPAPWDAGEPQPAIVGLAADGGFTGTVIDVGCGAGENALHLASLGYDVLGVDVAETALDVARGSAARRGIEAEFAVADALDLARLGRRFDTVLDSGLFHTFDAAERTDYVASLSSVINRGGIVHVLCFSDATPDTGGGPHHISNQMLTTAFDRGWDLVSVESSQYESRFGNAPAWLVTFKRI